MIGNSIKIIQAENGYIIQRMIDDELVNTVIREDHDVDNTVQLLNTINDIVGPTYNKYSEENDNIYVIKGPGKKAEKFSKFYDIIWGDNK